MNRKLFGTDGIRGLANTSPMDALTVLKVGMAAGYYFSRGSHRHKVVIGKDTRLSGYMIEPALTSGFVSMGMDVVLIGPMPTPAVAIITRSMRADLGVMISASHNPYHDNGIKLFGPNGLKLSDQIEAEIEVLAHGDMSKLLAEPKQLGRAKRLDDAAGRYVEYVKHTFPRRNRLDGLKVVVDCANGAAYKLAPTILWELGAEVTPLSIKPDGFNINDNCGALHPENMCAAVKKNGANLGIALDGDADRLIICDENGEIIDGDQIMGAIAMHLHNQGKLANHGLVATVMSNLGLENFLKHQGLRLERTKVGDRYVIEAMRAKGYNLGGEQSGHIVLSDYCTTGDGLIAALQVLAILVQSGRPASEVLRIFTPYPQVLRNIRYDKTKGDPTENPSVLKAVELSEKTLGENGRIVLRKSGTEPLIRVMVESNDETRTHEIANVIAATIEQAQAA